MWVKAVIRDRHDIMAVQTLRNQLMAATFLASTAILISCFRGSRYPGCQSRGAALHHRYAGVLSGGAAGPVAVRSDLNVGRQFGVGYRFISPGSRGVKIVERLGEQIEDMEEEVLLHLLPAFTVPILSICPS